MLRAAVLILAVLMMAFGGILCFRSVANGGIQLMSLGALVLLGTLFERWRYYNKNVAAEGDWQVTGERFVDPASGKNVEVLYDPQSGERRYEDGANS